MPAQRVDILSVLLLLTRHCHDVFGPGVGPKRVLITLANGEDYLVPVPALTVPRAEEAGEGPPGREPAPAPARHSPDFRSVHWHGTDHAFNPTQAACVRLLWEAWENGTPDVGSDTLLEAAGDGFERVKHVFREHRAFNAMVRQVRRGTYRLASPESNENATSL